MIGIVAIASNGVIGNGGALPWPRIPEDLRFFKEFTYKKKILVGRKTFEGLPKLKGRNVYVLTRDYKKQNKVIFKDNDETAAYFVTPEEVTSDMIVCGGAQIYGQLLYLLKELYVTRVNGKFEGDIWFPYSWDSLDILFKRRELIKTFDGGHNLFKYSKV